jgi:hypothetical protein
MQKLWILALLVLLPSTVAAQNLSQELADSLYEKCYALRQNAAVCRCAVSEAKHDFAATEAANQLGMEEYERFADMIEGCVSSFLALPMPPSTPSKLSCKGRSISLQALYDAITGFPSGHMSWHKKEVDLNGDGVDELIFSLGCGTGTCQSLVIQYTSGNQLCVLLETDAFYLSAVEDEAEDDWLLLRAPRIYCYEERPFNTVHTWHFDGSQYVVAYTWRGGIVTAKKAFFYDDEGDIGKSYLVSGDEVTILSTKGDFFFVRYTHPERGTTVEGWLKRSDVRDEPEAPSDG